MNLGFEHTQSSGTQASILCLPRETNSLVSVLSTKGQLYSLDFSLRKCFVLVLVSGRLRLRSFVRGFRILEGDFKPLSSPLEKKDSSLTLFVCLFFLLFLRKNPP